MRADYVLYKAKYAGLWYWRARFNWDEQSGRYRTSKSLGIPVDGKRSNRLPIKVKKSNFPQVP